MQIASIHITRFRSIFDQTLHCDTLTALVGANGVGKSAFLRGLELFYSPSPKLEPDDFYAGDSTHELIVSVAFCDLSSEAKKLFGPYLQGDTLTIDRTFRIEDGKLTSKYHGAALLQPAFGPVREAFDIKDRGKTAKERYEQIRGTVDFDTLPVWSNATTAAESLTQWEADHPDKCARGRDDGQFFGFKEVAQGYLGRFTKFLFIPAVRDAIDDTSDGKNSVFSALLDLVVRSTLASSAALKDIEANTQKAYTEALSPEKLTELTTLSDDMSKTLRTFVPTAKVELQWRPLSQIQIPLPQADVRLAEDGYVSTVGRAGHGLQRAFIMTMLQHLAFAQPPASIKTVEAPETEGADALPNLVLAIEEPELYQHPSRQRHLAKILIQLASGSTPGVAKHTQVIYGTHSALFVGIDRINQIRLLRKVSNGANPKCTRVIQTTLDKVAKTIWTANGAVGTKYSAATLLPRLQTIMTPWMSEGFFADVAVLVEGEDDRAALLGAANTAGHDLESNGIAIIPCGGKTNLDRPAAIFGELGIPVYVVWDSDYGDPKPRPEDNRRLLRLAGAATDDWPEGTHDRFSCFKVNLETTLRDEIGPDTFDKLLAECQAAFDIPKRTHALKNPVVISTILKKAAEEGKTSPTLTAILARILALKPTEAEVLV